MTRSQETGLAWRNINTVGCDGWEKDMTTQTKILAGSKAVLMIQAALVAAFIGGAMLFVAGHAQSATLHDAAHDLRHATGFPCH